MQPPPQKKNTNKPIANILRIFAWEVVDVHLYECWSVFAPGFFKIYLPRAVDLALLSLQCQVKKNLTQPPHPRLYQEILIQFY